MQWENLGDPLTWLWIIIWWLIAWLMFFLTLWIVDGKRVAKSKLAALALVAFIAVLIIPLLQGVTGLTTLLNGLPPYIAFFIVILLMVGLITDSWKTATIVSFVGILFLLIIYNILLLAGVSQVEAWPLFV
ncbi:MAG TPA: hypothetical protein VMV49_01735 [Candidatus Deferrimicrobium sp.]|nr:hypothetical protein [Candidatus Deferrimicrobium sp.]